MVFICQRQLDPNSNTLLSCFSLPICFRGPLPVVHYDCLQEGMGYTIQVLPHSSLNEWMDPIIIAITYIQSTSDLTWRGEQIIFYKGVESSL